MTKPILYVHIGAQRLQAAWSKRRGTALHALFDAEYVMGDVASMGSSSEGTPAGASDALDALVSVCGAEPALRRGVELRVLVSDQWAPSVSVPWNASQYRSAAAIAEAFIGLREAGYKLSSADLVRLDDAPLRQPRLAVCYPASLLELVGRLSAALRTQARSITTLSSLAWRALNEPAQMPSRVDRVLAIIEPGDRSTAQVILVRGQRASACIDEVLIRPLRLDDARRSSGSKSAAAVAAIVQRLGWNAQALSSTPDAESSSFSVIDLGSSDPLTGVVGPIAWWAKPQSGRDVASAHALDAVARSARPSTFKLLLLFVVLVSAALLSASLWSGTQRLRGALASVSAAERAALVPAAPPPSPDQVKRIAVVNAVISDLNVPLPHLLRALQPPRDIRVALLGLQLAAARETAGGGTDTRSTRPTLKIHAEAPTSRDMTQYVTYLAERKPLSHAYLVRHEVPDSSAAASDARAYRFTVEVAWND